MRALSVAISCNCARRVGLWGPLLCTLALLAFQGGAAEDSEELPLFPNIEFQALEGGTKVTMESFRGQPVLITFWASWCGPCRLELPELQKMHEEFGERGFVLITVNVDDSSMAAKRFLEVTRLEIPVYRVARADLLTLGVRNIPTNILLDLEGHPARIYEGYSSSVPEIIRGLVAAMLEDAGGEGA